MIAAEQSCFTCKEPGCGQVVSIESEFAVPVQTGCTSMSTAFRCPGCGRLYWGDLDENRGEPIMNRRFEKAFIDGNTIVNKPFSAEEKDELIKGYIQDSQVESLIFLAKSEHSPDCTTVSDKNSVCSCGVNNAQKFIDEHKG